MPTAKQLINNQAKRMKINFDQVLKTLDGENIKGEKDADLILKSVCTNALLVQLEDEKALAGEEKLKRWNLAQKVNVGGEVELKSEDVTKIKEMVGKAWQTLVVGQVFGMLEKEEAKTK